MNEQIIIDIKNLQVSYRGKIVLRDVNVEIPRGSRCAIVGPNGAGKSTLLKASLGLIKKDKGNIKIYGEDIKNISKKIAYVPQKGSVNWNFPITVFDVVMMGRYIYIPVGKKPKKEDEQIVLQVLEEMGMLEYKNRQISQLSGGQKQRVFLARALAQKVDLYILDEPLTGVDIKTEDIISDKFKELQKKGKTIVSVHHNLFSLEKYFDYLVILNETVKKQGKLEKVNKPEFIDLAFRG